MITTPISPAQILKGSPSPTSSTTGTGGKKTSRPPKGSKQFSSPLSNQSSSSSPSSIPPMTPNDQLPQQHIPPFKGPVIPPPTHYPFFPMNPMAIPNVPMMYAPMNPMHMIPTTTPMFGMFPQPVMPSNVPPPTTTLHNSKIPPPIQPKPSTSPPASSSTMAISQSSKPKAKKKRKPASNSTNSTPPVNSNRNVNSENSMSPMAISNNSKSATTSQQKRKAPPTTSRSIHEHIISYLWELGLKDSAKILENDLDNPLLLNAPEDRVSSFVNNLSNQVERHSHTILPSNKKISNGEASSTEETITKSNDSIMTDKFNPENFLNILKQTTKSEVNKPIAEHVNERLENLEEALGVKEQKVEVFARMQEVEEKLLKLDVNNNNVQQVEPSIDSSETHEDNFFDSFFDTSEMHDDFNTDI